MESAECGAASLGIILAHYRRYVPLPELRRECGISRDGSKASNLVKAARRYGLKARGYSKQIESLSDLTTPFVVFWQFNHFLVVEGISKHTVYLNDPASGHRKVTLQQFSEGFTGIVITMEPTDEFQPGGTPKRIWKSLAARLSGSFAPLAICFIAGLLMVLPTLAMATYTRVFVDAVILEGRYGWLRPLLVAMTLTTAFQFCLSLIQTQFLRRIKISMLARLNSQFYWHLLHLPVEFYSQRYPGEIAERAELNDSLVETLTEELVQTLIAAFTMLFYGVILVYYDTMLTLIGTLFAGLNFLVLHLVARRRIEANMKAAQDQGNVQATMIAGIASVETIKAGGSEDAFFEKWSGYFAKAANARMQLEGASQPLHVLPGLTTILTSVFILIVGGFRVIEGAITIGMLIAIQTIMSSFLEPVSRLLSLGTKIQEMYGSLNRLDDVLENPTIRVPPQPARPSEDVSKVKLDGDVRIEEVTFGYSPLESPLLENLSLRIRPGQRVALIGGSGSGKSTLARVICGLLPRWSGEIYYDDEPIDDVPRNLLRNSLAFVEQELFLFEGTVRENLTLWDPTVQDQALLRALSDAHILDIIMALPGGLESKLPEGGLNLSGGQRQRLEIARALVNDPRILILDEATSALDAETEQIIDENLRRRGCTAIIVAHRLSTIRDCEEIIVMERGKIKERGTHQELWQQDGAYTGLLRLSDQQDEPEAIESV